MKRPLTDTIRGDFKADIWTRRHLMYLSEQFAKNDKLGDEATPIVEETPGRSRDEVTWTQKQDLRTWRPQAGYSSLVLSQPMDVDYRDGTYVLKARPDAPGRPLRIEGPPPSSNYHDAHQVEVVLSKGGRVQQLKLHYLARQKPPHRWVSEPFVLIEALRKVQQSGNTPGVDGVTPDDLNEGSCWALSEAIRDEGMVEPRPSRMFFVRKSDGRFRPINVPTARDRVIQTAVYNVINTLMIPYFSNYSFAYQPDTGVFDAFEAVRDYLNEGHRWIAALDLKDCFENIPHDLIKDVFEKDMGDRKLGRWVVKLVSTYSIIDHETTRRITDADPPEPYDSMRRTEVRTRGVPQGGPLSPAVLNTVLNRFDQWCEGNGYRFVRYGDDVLLFARKKSTVEKHFDRAAQFMEGQLGMKLNREKSKLLNTYEQSFEYLGLVFDRGVVRPGEPAEPDNFRSEFESIRHRDGLQKALQFAKGYSAYVRKYVKNPDVFEKLDSWLVDVLSEAEEVGKSRLKLFSSD